MRESWLLGCLLLGSVGAGFLLYGRKQRAIVPTLCGLALMIFPYFVSRTGPMLAIGAVIAIIPFLVRF